MCVDIGPDRSMWVLTVAFFKPKHIGFVRVRTQGGHKTTQVVAITSAKAPAIDALEGHVQGMRKRMQASMEPGEEVEPCH